jgi:hypothetical protein
MTLQLVVVEELSVIQKSLLSQRASEADWRPLVDSMTDVQKLVHLGGRMDQSDRDEFQKRRFDEGRETWKQALQVEVDKWGCAGTKALPPSSGQELSDIKARTDFAADSVTGTYNLNLAREIIRIGQDAPRANRHVYAYRLFRLGGWDQGYWASKSIEVAQNESMVHINAAIEAFYARNGDLLQPAANVVPFTAAESECQAIVDGNPYDSVATIYQKFTLPVHPNCPHTAQVIAGKRLSPNVCRELWAGG